MRTPAFAFAILAAVATIVSLAQASPDCDACRVLHDDVLPDLRELKSQVSQLDRQLDALQRQSGQSHQSGSDRATETLQREVEQLRARLASAEQEIKRLHGPRNVRLVVTHSLTHTGGTQRCDADEVVASYEHREGDARIRGDCAELRLE